MKKLIRIGLVLAGLGALGVLPFRAADVAELIPVRTILVTRSGASYEVNIGEGLRALGDTVKKALEALREQAPGEVFYETAEQVLVTETAAQAVEEIAGLPELRPAAGLWLTPDSSLDLQAAGDYLAAHPADLTLTEVRARLLTGEPPSLPRLIPTEGGFRVDA